MERSILYNIEPIGVGTPFVESLTGYITRLADAHCIYTGTLISKVYSKQLNKDYISKISIRGGNGFFDSAIGINGLGQLSLDFIKETERLTSRQDLRNLTLTNWSAIFPTRGLLRKTKSWCPACYETARDNKETVYDQLIWNFQIVNQCSIHNTPLEYMCYNCNNLVPVINRKSRPGYCSVCESWLGFFPNENYCERNWNPNHLSTEQLVGDLLSNNNLHFSNNTVFESVNFYVNESFNYSFSKAANYFGIPASTFLAWKTGKCLPNIGYLSSMCKILDISIIEFLQKREVIITKGFLNQIESNKRNYDHTEIMEVLRNAIASKQPISISEIAKMIGCDRKLLSRKYPEECKQIIDNYNNYIQEKKQERLKSKIQQLEEAFSAIVRNKVYPSRRRLEEILGEGFLKEKVLQERWIDLKTEIDIVG